MISLVLAVVLNMPGGCSSIDDTMYLARKLDAARLNAAECELAAEQLDLALRASREAIKELEARVKELTPPKLTPIKRKKTRNSNRG